MASRDHQRNPNQSDKAFGQRSILGKTFQNSPTDNKMWSRSRENVRTHRFKFDDIVDDLIYDMHKSIPGG